jgi:hypothetical protein
MKFFSRFFATKPDFSKPDSVIEQEPVPGTEEFDDLMCMVTDQRRALLELTRLVCSHLPKSEVQAICSDMERTMKEGGDVDEVIAACLSEEPILRLKPKFFLTAEPGRLREACEIYPVLNTALDITEPLPSAVISPAGHSVALSIAEFGDHLIRNGFHPLHLEIESDTYFMLCVETRFLTHALALAESCGLRTISNDAFRAREIDA